MLSDEELLIVMRGQMTFDREEKAVVIERYFAVDCLATYAQHKQTDIQVEQGKVIPLQTCYRSMVCRKLRLPDYWKIGT